ncbi:hypothetical protein [Nocardioides sp. J9]|uniref:hypothetical protein n=1 Tax=Nocardioides sp. J9 TaxID=935844 RepID=UPI0016440EEF|nr:hypothetical protein [Nocardioides sp. J9]
MLMRPAELEAIREGRVDLAFRRWDRPRVKVGTRLRTAVGLVEVVSVEQVPLSSLRAEDARRAGAHSLAALKDVLAARAERPVFRVGLRYAGVDPRETLRGQLPGPAEVVAILAGLDRLDAASPVGPWTRDTLRLIDRNPEVRAPELAARLGRPTAEFKRDVRKLKERGLTESLAIGYHICAVPGLPDGEVRLSGQRLSPRGEVVLDHEDGPRERAPRREGTPLPRTIGAPATRALRAVDLHTLQAVSTWTRHDLAALHGVGPIALDRLEAALAQLGLSFADRRPG